MIRKNENTVRPLSTKATRFTSKMDVDLSKLTRNGIKQRYKFETKVEGDINSKTIMFSAGYNNDPDQYNFVLNVEKAQELINILQSAVTYCEETNVEVGTKVLECRNKVKTLIKAELIDYVSIELLGDSPESYGLPDTYKLFKITPIFKEDEVRKAASDPSMNLEIGFNYVDAFEFSLFNIPMFLETLCRELEGTTVEENQIEFRTTNFNIKEMQQKEANKIKRELDATMKKNGANDPLARKEMFNMPEDQVKKVLDEFGIPFEKFQQSRADFNRVQEMKKNGGKKNGQPTT